MPNVVELQESVIIHSQPQRVWELIVDSEDRLHWWPNLDVDVRVGGEVREVWKLERGTVVTVGIVNEIVGGQRLGFTWKDPSWRASTDVQIVVTAHADGAEVSVREIGFERLEATDDLLAEHRAAWIMHLADLRVYAEK
jgi:uncharacterized protein YndB with AHSA1/START domain